jgi:hypothetical protein
MCRGYRWRYWATGLPGWMRGGGWGGPGWGHPGHGPWGYAHGPAWAGGSPYGFGSWGGTPTAEDEMAFLRDEAEGLKHYLEGIERRISELEKMAKQPS